MTCPAAVDARMNIAMLKAAKALFANLFNNICDGEQDRFVGNPEFYCLGLKCGIKAI